MVDDVVLLQRLLDQQEVEAVELGAAAHIKVEGKWNDDLMKQVTPPGPIPPEKVGAIAPNAVTR